MKCLKKNKKGFTLVELIVVLVILAILVALLIPTLTGYIDKTNKQSAAADLKLIANAANSAYAEVYADDPGASEIIYSSSAGGWFNQSQSTTVQDFKNSFMKYLGDDINFNNIQSLFVNKTNVNVYYKYKAKVYLYKRVGSTVTIEEYKKP